MLPYEIVFECYSLSASRTWGLPLSSALPKMLQMSKWLVCTSAGSSFLGLDPLSEKCHAILQVLAVKLKLCLPLILTVLLPKAAFQLMSTELIAIL